MNTNLAKYRIESANRDQYPDIQIPTLQPDTIDAFVTWFLQQGHSLRSLQISDMKTKQHYVKRFFKENPQHKQLSLLV